MSTRIYGNHLPDDAPDALRVTPEQLAELDANPPKPITLPAPESGASVAPRFKVGDKATYRRRGGLASFYNGSTCIVDRIIEGGKFQYESRFLDSAGLVVSAFPVHADELTPLSAPSAPSPEEAANTSVKLPWAPDLKMREADGPKCAGCKRSMVACPIASGGVAWVCYNTNCNSLTVVVEDSRVVSPSAGARMNELQARGMMAALEIAAIDCYTADESEEDSTDAALNTARARLLAALIGPSQPSTDTESR